ncbi:MAG: sugar transferase [Candidatus Kerfeldbacteria bacterium]|nr:sugar transferase [Candidatus Kerfeldbacteria bacterium]
MKRTDLFLAALLVPLDYLVLVLAGWAAYALRFDQVAQLLPVATPLPFAGYIRTVLVVALGWIVVLAAAGVYATRQRRVTGELGRIFLGASTGVLMIIVFIFFRREFFTSRFIILAGWVLSILFLWASHLLVRGVQRLMLTRGVGVRQAVIVGNDATTNHLLSTFHSRPELGVRVLRHYPQVDPSALAELGTLIQQQTVDEVIQAEAGLSRAQALELLDHCLESNVSFRYAADVLDTQVARVDMDYVAGVPIMELKRTPLDGWGRILKRTFDLVGSTLGLIVCAVPGAIVAGLIKLDSAGPVFVRLERVGEGQKRFRLWKFRSMIRDAEALKPQLMDRNERADGPLFKIKDDPRITRLGKFLRRTSIDELPQLINVVRGQMSLVGPRPHEPAEVARYEKHHKKLLTIKPGITGMAQISGRSNLSFDDEAHLDTYYIEHWSFGLDAQILLRTPAAVLSTKSAA